MTVAPNTEKRCTLCDNTRHISEFAKDRHRKDGLDQWCKHCRRERSNLWRRKYKPITGRRLPNPVSFDGATAYIQLLHGLVAIVDRADYPLVSDRHWWATKSHRRPGNYYVHSQTGGQLIALHRLIMNPSPGEIVDHRDGDGLNNRRTNLRRCSCADNTRNTRLSSIFDARHRPKASRYRGVGLVNGRYWIAQIRHRYLGYFPSEEDAARAYDRAAIEEFGEFARLNFPPSLEEHTP